MTRPELSLARHATTLHAATLRTRTMTHARRGPQWVGGTEKDPAVTAARAVAASRLGCAPKILKRPICAPDIFAAASPGLGSAA
jgi:hypothetical protein